MPEVDIRVDARSLPAVLFSWLAGVLAIPLSLLIAVIGQGAGAYLGDCGWIGLSLPLDRQVWALVNQPVMNFASTAAAVPYWLGSLILPLMLAATLVPFIPRARSLAGELFMVQLAFVLAVVGGAWLPLLDPKDGHLVRLLGFRFLPDGLVWLAPVAAAATVALPALRLLAVARVATPHLSRAQRVWIVFIHLTPPVAAWMVLVSVLRGDPPQAPVLAGSALVVVALVVAWAGYPARYARPLEELTGAAFTSAAVVLTLLVGLWFFAGRPLPDEQRAGLLWAHGSDFNNIRQWIRPNELGS
jgi:hypothetical protein